ncbi:unnamed protein product, partial [Dibothriocephalus latus]
MDQIGMAPGGEFRVAFKKASQQPHCHLVLGDRPINVTLSRTLDAFSLWQKIRLFCALVFNFESITPANRLAWFLAFAPFDPYRFRRGSFCDDKNQVICLTLLTCVYTLPISKEEIEAMKKHDLLEELLKNMAGSFPELSRVILEERDLYLARSIWEVCGFPQTPVAPPSNPKDGEGDSDQSVVHRHQGQQQPSPTSSPATNASHAVEEETEATTEKKEEASGDVEDASGEIR